MDSFTHALGVLDPANRALLDLSLRRGMRPEEISDLLGTDPESVIVAREQALEQLAAELGMADVSEIDDVRVRLAELPAEAWTPPPPDDPEPAGKANDRPALSLADAEEEKPARAAEPAEPAAPRPGRSRRPLMLAVLAAAAVVLVVVLASSGGSDQKNTAATPAPTPKPVSSKPATPKPPAPAKPTRPAKPAAATGPRVALAAVFGGGGASGTAALAGGGKRLVLDVSGLPARKGAYQVWLYNSVIDAKSLATEAGTNVKVDLKLPPNAGRYRYLDISFEPKDGNPNHSGASVLRVALAKLAR
jgi:hypothetical protein